MKNEAISRLDEIKESLHESNFGCWRCDWLIAEVEGLTAELARLRATSECDQGERDEAAGESTRATGTISEGVWRRAADIYCAERDEALIAVAALTAENARLCATLERDQDKRENPAGQDMRATGVWRDEDGNEYQLSDLKWGEPL